MAPRKTAKNPSQAISEAIDTKPENNLYDLAVGLGITLGELRERLSAKLDNSDPLDWETVPTEHEPLLKIIANEVEAGKTRQLHSVEAPEAVVEPEIPVLEEEVKPVKTKRKSSALTKGKADKIQETKEETKQTSVGINETLTLLQAQEAKVDSSHDATAYLATYATNLTNLKGEGLAFFAAQSLQKISNSSGFNPQEIMQQVGVTLSAETQAKLNETMGQVLGKSQAAAQEIQETAWGNGYNLQAELLNLENLMNSED